MQESNEPNTKTNYPFPVFVYYSPKSHLFPHLF
jgi:hypothetical protein